MVELLCQASVIETILFIIVCLSIPFYILFLLMLIVNRKKEPFNSHFFMLTISLGVSDLATIFHSYIFIRIPGWGCPEWLWKFLIKHGPDGTFLPFYAIAMQFSLGFAQFLGVLLIALNRMTKMVLADITYDWMWSGHKFKIAVFMQWFVPVVFLASFVPQRYEYSPWQGRANIDFTYRGEAQTIYYGISMVFNFVINTVSCIMYVMVFFVAFKQARKRKKQIVKRVNREGRANAIIVQKMIKQKNAYARELKLAFTGFALCICMLVYFAFLLLIAVTGDFDYAFLFYIACDLFGCVNPYSILMMSIDARRCFLRFVRCRSQ